MNEVLRSKAVRWIGLGWTAFIVENVVLSHNRDYIIERYGDVDYHNAYNFLSTTACGSIAWGYLKHGRRKGPTLNPRGKAIIAFGSLIQIVGLVGLSQVPPKLQLPFVFAPSDPVISSNNNLEKSSSNRALQIRCPMDFKSSDIPLNTVYGMERISRHATFWSLGLACAGYAMTTIYISEIVMFGFPLVFAFIGSEHQDYRYNSDYHTFCVL